MDSSCTIAETIAHHLTTLITPPDHSQPNQLRPQPITPAAGNKVKAFLIKRLKANRNSTKALWVEIDRGGSEFVAYRGAQRLKTNDFLDNHNSFSKNNKLWVFLCCKTGIIADIS